MRGEILFRPGGKSTTPDSSTAKRLPTLLPRQGSCTMNEVRSEADLFNQLAHEFAERYRRGERPPLTEYTDRNPELADQIRELFPALVMMEEFGSVTGQTTGPFSQLPKDSPVPKQLGEYRI